MDEIVFDRITFLITASKKRALKLQCVERGVTMTDAMTEAVDRMVGGEQPPEVADLVAAARDALGELSKLSDHFYKLEAALAPFDSDVVTA